MKRLVAKGALGSMGGAVRALLVVLLCFSPRAEAARKKVKAVPKPVPVPQLTMKPVAKKTEDRLPAALPRNVFEIARDQVDSNGVGYVFNGDKSLPVRLPSSVNFREGNLFSAEGRWIRVVHLSKNSREPAFRLGRREKYFRDHALYPQEESLLEYAQLHLFPRPAAQTAKVAVENWMADLDSFLSLHRHDPVVVRQVESFVFKFSNHPPRGYLPGDQLWDTRRQFATWNQFFEYPLQYDLSGVALTVDGKPLDNIPVEVPKEKIASLPKLYPNVLRNIEYTFEALRTVMFEGSEGKGDDGLAEVTAIRRSYLTLKLLKSGQELWERIQANAK
jgi:hypothetical protein